MKHPKILAVGLIMLFFASIEAMDPDVKTGNEFRAEPEFALLKRQAAGMATVPVREVRVWFAKWTELVNKKPAYRVLSKKAQGLEKLFGGDFAATIGNPALQQRGNVSLGALLTAYETWVGTPITGLDDAIKRATEAANDVATAAKGSTATDAQITAIKKIGTTLSVATK